MSHPKDKLTVYLPQFGGNIVMYKLIGEVAKTQNGVITRYELLKLGYTRSNIQTMLRKSFLKTTYKSIYTICGSKDTWLQRAAIQTKRFESGLLSNESVLHLYKIFDYKFDRQKYLYNRSSTRGLIHVVNKHKYAKDKNVFIHKTTQYLDCDIGNVHNEIAHVSLERAIIDCSHQLNDDDLSYAIEKSIRMRLTTLDRFYNAVEILRVGPGRDISRILETINRMNSLLLKPEIESYFETKIENIITPISKYKLRRQYKISASGFNMRVDFAIPELKIIIEADGYDHHGGRMAYDKDKLRYAVLQAMGWLVLNVTTKMSKQTIRKLFVDIQTLRSVSIPPTL